MVTAQCDSDFCPWNRIDETLLEMVYVCFNSPESRGEGNGGNGRKKESIAIQVVTALLKAKTCIVYVNMNSVLLGDKTPAGFFRGGGRAWL